MNKQSKAKSNEAHAQHKSQLSQKQIRRIKWLSEWVSVRRIHSLTCTQCINIIHFVEVSFSMGFFFLRKNWYGRFRFGVCCSVACVFMFVSSLYSLPQCFGIFKSKSSVSLVSVKCSLFISFLCVFASFFWSLCGNKMRNS